MKSLFLPAQIGSIVVGLSAFAYAFWELSDPRPAPTPGLGEFRTTMPPTPFVWPAPSQPPTVSADRAMLPDEEPVLGLLVNGTARAYRVKAFAGMTNHVVNDLIESTPVTVTHCDRDGCSRIFTGPGTEPLDIMTTGFNEGLLLSVDGQIFRQSDGDGPNLRSLPFEKTTWKAWRNAHPATDVYVEVPEPTPPRARGKRAG